MCVCSIHQNAILLVDAIDWDYTYKDLIQKVVCNPENKDCRMHRCASCPGTAALEKFVSDELSHPDMDENMHYIVNGTLQIEQHLQHILQPMKSTKIC